MSSKISPKQIIDISQDVSYTKKVNGLIQASAKDKAIANKFSLPKFHWVKDKPDSRDYLYQSTLTTKSSKVDLRPFCTPIEDQGNLGSCTGQAIAGAIEYLNKKAGKTTDISRLFIYYYERAMINTVHYDSGAYIRDGIKVVYKNGAPLEKFWPYNIRRFTQSPSAQAITDAKNRKVSLYERITTLDGCINALSNGFPVTVGFYVYNSFTSRQVTTTGIMPYPNVARERLLGGHAVLLVGYDNTTNRFIARNSWGSNWGDRGYFYMPYQVIDNRSMSDDFWVIRTVNNPR